MRFEDYEGVKVAREINVLKDTALAMRIKVVSLTGAETKPAKYFELPGHSWNRAFTDEVR